MRRRLFLVFFATCSSLLVNCESSESLSSQTTSIIDEDSLSPVGDGSQWTQPLLRDSLGAIGRMTGGCTAFHLGDGLVATAGHCLPAPRGDLKEASCATYHIQWPGEAQASRCLHYVAHRFDEKADFALIAVDPAPKGEIRLSDQPGTRDAPARALVIGYPKDKPLSASESCETRSSADPESPLFFHRCDTLPGHSGSPVLSETDGRLIGVHDGDADHENYGSFLPPVDQIQKWKNELAEARPAASTYQFGPFAHNENRLLTHIRSRWGKRVRFRVRTELEAPYDKLIITDGIGRKTEVTSRLEKELDLPAPLVFEVQTDYSGPSQEVQLTQIESYTPG